MAINKAEFEVNSHPNFIGIGKNAKKNTKMQSATLSGTYVYRDEVRVEKFENDVAVVEKNHSEYYARQINKKADFSYRFKGFPVAFNYASLYKGNILLSGYSLGLDPTPFIRYVFGVNCPFFEVGAFGDLGVSVNNASYEYKRVFTNQKSVEDGKKHDASYGYLWANFGAFASIYVGGFSINYSPSYFAPWRKSFLDQYDDLFDFPEIIVQYVGLSQWFGNHWKFSLGVNIANSTNFDNYAISGTGSLGYWF